MDQDDVVSRLTVALEQLLTNASAFKSSVERFSAAKAEALEEQEKLKKELAEWEAKVAAVRQEHAAIELSKASMEKDLEGILRLVRRAA